MRGKDHNLGMMMPCMGYRCSIRDDEVNGWVKSGGAGNIKDVFKKDEK